MSAVPQFLRLAFLACVSWGTFAHAALPIETWKTDSGAKVLFMRAEALPMIDVQIGFPAGSREDPFGKEGLAGFASGLIGTATSTLDETAIADGFADTGAVFSSGASADYATVSLRSLTSQPQLDQSVALFKQVISDPVFKKDIFTREVNRSLAGLKESLTKPDTLASRAFFSALYPGHPYGRLTDEASIQAIELEDLKTFYQSRYLANYAVVAIVGDLTVPEAKALANTLTGSLPQNTLPGNLRGGASFEALQAKMKGQTQVIPHPAAQSHILLGLPAMKRGDPEYFDLLVANHIIGGGGFVSRLMKEIREERGLAYSAYSYFMPMGDAGPFQAGLQTKKEQTAEALSVLRATLDQFITEGPSQAELDNAKSNLVDGFPLRIDSNGELAGNLIMMGLYDLPLNYLDVWTEQISRVTLESAKKAFASHVVKDKLVTVVVGPETLPGQ